MSAGACHRRDACKQSTRVALGVSHILNTLPIMMNSDAEYGPAPDA